jgi:hypothetical protein
MLKFLTAIVVIAILKFPIKFQKFKKFVNNTICSIDIIIRKDFT